MRRPGPAPRRRPPVALGLTLLAWAHRAAFLFSNRDWSWPFTIFYEGDSEAFYRYARALLAGRLYDEGVPFHPPGFAWLLAAVQTLVGAGGPATRAAPRGAAPTGARRERGGRSPLPPRPPVPGRGVALASARPHLYHFGSYVLAVAPVSEGPYLTLLLLASWCGAGGWNIRLIPRRLRRPIDRRLPRAVDRSRSASGPFFSGVLLGLLALTRVEGALVALLLSSASASGGGCAAGAGHGPRLAPWALVAAGWLLAVAPWAARNAVRLAEFNERHAGRLAEPLPLFVPLTLYGPLNVALGNHPGSDGTFSPAPLTAGGGTMLDLEDPRHLEMVLHGQRMAWRWARGAPGAAARLVLAQVAALARRLAARLDAVGPARRVDRRATAGGRLRPDLRRRRALTLWLGPPLALARARGLPRRRRRGAAMGSPVVLLLTLVWALVVGLTFGYARQGLLVLPLSRWTLDRGGVSRRGCGGSRRGARALADRPAAAAALLVLELIGAAGDRTLEATGDAISPRGVLNRDATIYFKPLPRR